MYIRNRSIIYEFLPVERAVISSICKYLLKQEALSGVCVPTVILGKNRKYDT